MNRKDLQGLANLRLREAQALFNAREYSGTYYLAGYAVECSLKACIAKLARRHDFADKQRVNDSYTHDLKKLAVLSGVSQAILDQASNDETFGGNWDLILRWSEKSRYATFDRVEAKALLDAIMDEHHGFMPWIRQRW
jgi:hypothetical protein